IPAAIQTRKPGGRDAKQRRERQMVSGARGWLRRRRPPVRALTVVLVTVLVVGFNLRPSQVRADGGLIPVVPPDLLNVAQLIDSNGLYYATPAEDIALNDLQQQAIT